MPPRRAATSPARKREDAARLRQEAARLEHEAHEEETGVQIARTATNSSESFLSYGLLWCAKMFLIYYLVFHATLYRPFIGPWSTTYDLACVHLEKSPLAADDTLASGMIAAARNHTLTSCHSLLESESCERVSAFVGKTLETALCPPFLISVHLDQILSGMPKHPVFDGIKTKPVRLMASHVALASYQRANLIRFFSLLAFHFGLLGVLISFSAFALPAAICSPLAGLMIWMEGGAVPFELWLSALGLYVVYIWSEQVPRSPR